MVGVLSVFFILGFGLGFMHIECSTGLRCQFFLVVLAAAGRGCQDVGGLFEIDGVMESPHGA